MAIRIASTATTFTRKSLSFLRGKVHDLFILYAFRSSVIERNVVIGAETTIGEGTSVSHSTIGRNCRIGILLPCKLLMKGQNVVIEGAYIWDNVTIGDNCIVTRAIIADSVVLLNNVAVDRGCILGDNVRLF
jgi:translation initiation factor eIF-2B subunit epsilon